MVIQAGSPNHNTRASLLFRLKADSTGREIAWREFYELYSPIIAAFARRLGGKPQDVPDVLQDVLTGFFAAVPEFVYDPGKGRFRGYLKTCTWRVMQKRLGRELKFGGRSLDDVDPNEVQVETTWNDVWERQQLHRALDNVRDRYLAHPTQARTFKAFEMYVLLERPAEEVASELAISVDSVHQAKTRISQALKLEVQAMDEKSG